MRLVYACHLVTVEETDRIARHRVTLLFVSGDNGVSVLNEALHLILDGGQVGADRVKFEIMRWAVSKVVEESEKPAAKAHEEEAEEPEVKKSSKPKKLKKAAPVEEEAPEEAEEPAEEAEAEAVEEEAAEEEK